MKKVRKRALFNLIGSKTTFERDMFTRDGSQDTQVVVNEGGHGTLKRWVRGEVSEGVE